jgi:hypothetical protein
VVELRGVLEVLHHEEGEPEEDRRPHVEPVLVEGVRSSGKYHAMTIVTDDEMRKTVLRVASGMLR